MILMIYSFFFLVLALFWTAPFPQVVDDCCQKGRRKETKDTRDIRPTIGCWEAYIVSTVTNIPLIFAGFEDLTLCIKFLNFLAELESEEPSIVTQLLA
ncbi:MAG TPA: hypothetical protein DIS90_13500 [Cytophagales bacterium]|nr:hypothetical protein [Cytophagales bacterium]